MMHEQRVIDRPLSMLSANVFISGILARFPACYPTLTACDCLRVSKAALFLLRIAPIDHHAWSIGSFSSISAKNLPD